MTRRAPFWLLAALLTWASPAVAQPLTGDDAVRLQVGAVAVAQERYADAEKIFGDLLARHPRNPQAMNNLGLVYLRTDRLREAFALLQTLRVLKPDDPVVHFTLAQVYTRAGLPQEELEALKAAIVLRPDYSKAHLQLARALKDAGQVYAASAEYAWLLERAERRGKDPDPDVLYNLAQLYQKQGRIKEALGLSRRYIALAPDGPKADTVRAFLTSHAAPGEAP